MADVINTMKIQSAVNSVFWIMLALILVAIIGYFIFKIMRWFSYNYHVTIHKKVGNMQIKEEDKAKKILDKEGNYFLHYLKLNKKSPIIHDQFLKIVKKQMFGFFPFSMIGFDAYLIDGKVIPMMTNKAYTFSPNPGHLVVSNVALTGINYDDFNFLQAQIKTNMAKYQKVDRLMQMLPYIGLFIVVMAFIMGMVLYTKHIENVAQTILGYAKETAQKGIEQNGLAQIITGK